jgi:hypothetical protein
MNSEIRRTLGFAKSAFSESDGKASFTRIATAGLIAFALVWVTRLVWINHALPDFGGLTIFIGTLYGLNKASALATSITENKPDLTKASTP